MPSRLAIRASLRRRAETHCPESDWLDFGPLLRTLSFLIVAFGIAFAGMVAVIVGFVG